MESALRSTLDTGLAQMQSRMTQWMVGVILAIVSVGAALAGVVLQSG